MRQIVLLSDRDSLVGTYCAASLAHLASLDGPVVLIDADLDSTNLSLFLSTRPDQSNPWQEGKTAQINRERCKSCGACYDSCQFDAVSDGPPYTIVSLSCVGCGTCTTSCPVDAITLHSRTHGEWRRTKTRFGPLYHGQLEPGQRSTGLMITTLRQHATQWAQHHPNALIITDGPAGALLPSLATIAGIDLTIAVITASQVSVSVVDRLAGHLAEARAPMAVILESSEWLPSLESHCADSGIPILGQISNLKQIRNAMCSGRLETEHESPMSDSLRQIWLNTARLLRSSDTNTEHMQEAE